MKGRYALVDRTLEGRDYLTGDTFCVADAYLFTVTSWAPRLNLDLSAHKNLAAYLGRVAARPAVKEALRVESQGR